MQSKSQLYTYLATFAFSLMSVLLLFYWQGWSDFSLNDEGFLWYGAQRVMLGEIPLRDFMSYDPGRYYWSAAFMLLLGGAGIIQLRLALAAFQVLALFAALSLLLRSQPTRSKSQSAIWLLVSAMTLLVWMYPRHKLFDVGLSIFLIWVLAYLLERPEPWRYFLVGLAVGLAAVFGRNHSVYGALGSVTAMAWVACKPRSRPVAYTAIIPWGLGVALGFSPVLIAALVVRGFARALWEGVRFQFEMVTTNNIAVPVPWPWTLDFSALSLGDAARGTLIGLFFIACLLFGCAGLAWAFFARLTNRPVNPVFVSSACLALPYAHFAFSRAQIGHLAQGIFPFLIGTLSLLSSARAIVKWPFGVLLCLASGWMMLVYQPGWQCRSKELCVQTAISGSEIWVNAQTASDVALLRTLADEYAPGGRSFVAAPYWPGAYALMDRHSPMWEIYALLPRSAEFQDREIERIRSANPGFVVLVNSELDAGRDDLRFRNTHPLVQKFIEDNFDLLPNAPSADYQIFKNRDVAK